MLLLADYYTETASLSPLCKGRVRHTYLDLDNDGGIIHMITGIGAGAASYFKSGMASVFKRCIISSQVKWRSDLYGKVSASGNIDFFIRGKPCLTGV